MFYKVIRDKTAIKACVLLHPKGSSILNAQVITFLEQIIGVLVFKCLGAVSSGHGWMSCWLELMNLLINGIRSIRFTFLQFKATSQMEIKWIKVIFV